MNYALQLVDVVCRYVILSQSLNLAVGYAGLLSVSQAAFYGLGAYVTAMLMVDAGWSFLPSLAVAVIANGVFAWLVAVPATQLRGEFFLLATLGLQMIVYAVLYNCEGLTGGHNGIAGIPRPSLFGVAVATPLGITALTLALTVVCCVVVWRLAASPYGRALRSVREDPLAAASLGKDVRAIRRSAFVWAAAIAAVPGGLFAISASYIDPTSFRLEDSIFVLSVILIGGAGNLRGPFVGAFVLVLLPEVLRFVGLSGSAAANLRQILFGVAIILLMRFRPRGIAGEYAFD